MRGRHRGQHGFELDAGVGLVFEPCLGRRGALALWGVALPGWRCCSRRRRRARPWALLGLAMGEPLRRSARHHFRWLREQGGRV